MGENEGSAKNFGFVCFEDPKAAVKAATTLHCDEEVVAESNTPETEKDIVESSRLYVKRAVKKDLRKAQLRQQSVRFKKQMARQNLYFKGLPTD